MDRLEARLRRVEEKKKANGKKGAQESQLQQTTVTDSVGQSLQDPCPIEAQSRLSPDEEAPSSPVAPATPTAKNKGRIQAQFTRRRTNNEELCVACCGVILGRATFYGSEALNGIRVSRYCVALSLVLTCLGIDFLEGAFPY